jgi:hypothetical protein
MEEQNHKDLGLTLLRVLSDWGVEPEHQVILLGLPEGTKPRALQRYRSGEPLPSADDFTQRAHYILAIQNAVDSMYPHNAAAANYWVTTPTYFFGNRSPLEVMLHHGLEGMQRVINHLNGIDDWNL